MRKQEISKDPLCNFRFDAGGTIHDLDDMQPFFDDNLLTSLPRHLSRSSIPQDDVDNDDYSSFPQDIRIPCYSLGL